MTKRAIDRLGAMSYGALIVGIISGSIQRGLSPETVDSWPVLIPLVALSMLGGIPALYCLFAFIGHLFTENKRVGGAGKALWLVLLLLGNLVTMPVYWYCYIVRERLGEDERSTAALEMADTTTKTLA